MAKRISKKVIAAITADRFEEALAQYAHAEARETEIAAMLDAEMARIQAYYTDELGTLGNRKKEALEVVQTYCREQKEILFNKRRSMGTIYGTLGFRMGMPRLKTVRGTNWDTVLQQLKEKLPAYVRTIEEPAKDMLLADRNKEQVGPLLRDLGLQIVQEETFFIELKTSQPLAA